jgi:uncharacterized SAM-binding protein YcdF (DUF218 family)
MFFALSKLLYFIIQPIIWLIALLAWAYVTKNEQKRGKILRGCFVMVILMTNPFLSNRLYRAWEIKETPMATMKDTFDVGIVLGGYGDFELYAYNDRLNLGWGANRFLDALVLYKRGLIKKILLSCDDGRLLGDRVSEVDISKTTLLQLGIPESDIIIENKGRNTRENAVYTKELLEKMHLDTSRLLLITSAHHMRRSMGCFDKVGLKYTPFSAHFLAERVQSDINSTIIPDSRAFYKFEKLLKEMVGCVVYRLQGYI